MLTIGKLGPARSATTSTRSPKAPRTTTPARARRTATGSATPPRSSASQGKVDADQLIAMLTGRNPLDGEPLLGDARRPRPRPGPRLRPHLLRAEVRLPALGARRPRSPRPRSLAAHRALRRRRPRLHAARGLLDPARRRRRGVRPRQRLPRRRLPPPLLAHRRPPAPHPRPDRQRDPGAGRPLDPALPPGDLRPRQDRRLHLRGPPAPRADPQPRRRAGRRSARASPRSRASPTSTCAPSPPAGPRSSRRPAPDASARARQVANLDTREAKETRPRPRRACASAGARGPRRSASTARRSSATLDRRAASRSRRS